MLAPRHLLQAWVLLLAVLCSFFLDASNAQRVNYSALTNLGAKCVNTTDYLDEIFPTCRPYVAGQNYTYIDNYQYYRDIAIEVLSTTISSVNNCTARSIQIVCSMAYRECFEMDVPGYGSVAVGALPCKDFCDIWRADCLILYTEKGTPVWQSEAILNCTTLNPGWGFGWVQFPNGTTTQALNVSTGTNTSIEVNVTLPCADRAASIFAGYGDLVCPEGTHNVGPLACALDCPEPLISDNEYDQAKLMLSIVGWFSFVATAFVVVSFLLSPMDKLAYPSVLAFFFVVCIMCLSFTFCLGSMVGHEDIWCEDGETPHRWGDGWCTIQAITYVYFTLAGGLWWLSIAINLFVTVVFRYTASASELFQIGPIKFTHAYIIVGVCHLFCWGIPLVVIIITLSAERLGFGGSDFWCSIHSDENILFVTGTSGLETQGSSDAQAIDIWNLVLLTIPMILITMVGTTLFVLVIIVAVIKSKERVLFFVRQWRLLGLIMLYIWIYSFVFSAHVQFATQRKQQYEDYATYIDCLKANSLLTQYTNTGCELPKRVNFALWFIASFNVAAGGFFVFLIFGTSKGIVNAWANLLMFVGTGGKQGTLTSSTGRGGRPLGRTGSSSGSNKGGSEREGGDGKGLKKFVGMRVTSTTSTLELVDDEDGQAMESPRGGHWDGEDEDTNTNSSDSNSSSAPEEDSNSEDNDK